MPCTQNHKDVSECVRSDCAYVGNMRMIDLPKEENQLHLDNLLKIVILAFVFVVIAITAGKIVIQNQVMIQQNKEMIELMRR